MWCLIVAVGCAAETCPPGHPAPERLLQLFVLLSQMSSQKIPQRRGFQDVTGRSTPVDLYNEFFRPTGNFAYYLRDLASRTCFVNSNSSFDG
jgi:hypothetical protein